MFAALKNTGATPGSTMITRIHSKFLTIGLVSLGLATGCSRGMAAKVQPEPANEPAHSPAAAVPVQVLPSPALTQAGGASMLVGAARVTLWGAVAMLVTAAVGRLTGTAAS